MVCLLVPFVQNFVAKTCRSIIDDDEELDAIQDGFYIISSSDSISSSGFARPLDSNMLNLIFCSVIVAFCNSSMLIAKLSMRTCKRVLSKTQMVGTRLVRPGHTGSSTCRMLRVALVWHLMMLTSSLAWQGGFGVASHDVRLGATPKPPSACGRSRMWHLMLFFMLLFM